MIKTALGFPIISKTWGKAWEGLFASQQTIYICVVLLAALVACAYEFRTSTIFSCQADGYNSDRYVAYCQGAHYADYEHGAFYFDLEPSVQNYVRDTDVLFLGTSRLQFAFSTTATADWFAAASARYYLMGFTYFEDVLFAEKLLRKIHPRAKVYVINVDGFFDRSETSPAKAVLHDPEARHRYETKRLWQHVHEPVCKALAALCGHKTVIFRSRETGAYAMELAASEQKIIPVSYDQGVDQGLVASNTAAAVDFLSEFTQGKCVILTNVPLVGTKIGNSNAIAAGLGMKLTAPEILEGLQTFDGFHLDQPSAERWSQSFFRIAGPEIRSCLEGQNTARS
jgi:hypothetical protein